MKLGASFPRIGTNTRVVSRSVVVGGARYGFLACTHTMLNAHMHMTMKEIHQNLVR